MPEATDIIRHEHVMIMVMVRVIEAMSARHAQGLPLNTSDMPSVTNFFVRYADRLHHAKEEEVLFPAILRHDPESLPVLDELLADHQRGRMLLDEFERALAAGDRDAYFTVVDDYTSFIRPHIQRENNLLLPTADTFFTADEQRALATQLVVLQNRYMSVEEYEATSKFREAVTERYLRERT